MNVIPTWISLLKFFNIWVKYHTLDLKYMQQNGTESLQGKAFGLILRKVISFELIYSLCMSVIFNVMWHENNLVSNTTNVIVKLKKMH